MTDWGHMFFATLNDQVRNHFIIRSLLVTNNVEIWSCIWKLTAKVLGVTMSRGCVWGLQKDITRSHEVSTRACRIGDGNLHMMLFQSLFRFVRHLPFNWVFVKTKTHSENKHRTRPNLCNCRRDELLHFQPRHSGC